jgi:hypothetical protein
MLATHEVQRTAGVICRKGMLQCKSILPEPDCLKYLEDRAAMNIKPFLAIAAFLLLACSTQADEPLWPAEFDDGHIAGHAGQSGWVVRPSVKPAEPQFFSDVPITIFTQDIQRDLRPIALE